MYHQRSFQLSNPSWTLGYRFKEWLQWTAFSIMVQRNRTNIYHRRSLNTHIPRGFWGTATGNGCIEQRYEIAKPHEKSRKILKIIRKRNYYKAQNCLRNQEKPSQSNKKWKKVPRCKRNHYTPANCKEIKMDSQSRMKKEEKLQKLQEKSLQSCKIAWQIKTNTQSQTRNEEESHKNCRRNQYTAEKLHEKSRQILKVKQEREKKVALLQKKALLTCKL